MNDTEVLSAATEIIAHGLGAAERDPHPLAEQLKRTPLTAVALAVARSGAQARPNEAERSAIVRGMLTSEFQNALIDGMQLLVQRKFETSARHRAFCSMIDCTDFGEQSIASGVGSFNLPETNEGAELESRPVKISAGTGVAKLRTFGRILSFSRELLVNDNVRLVTSALSAGAYAAAALEARLVYSALESSSLLDDGGPVFHLDYGNVVEAALDKDTLGQAVDLLARQVDGDGNFGDLQPKHLTVESGLAVAASRLIRESGLPIHVTATANLPAGRWYVHADHMDHPAIGVLRLEGKDAPAVVFKQTGGGAFAYRLIHDTEAVMLGRTGIVRGGV